MKNKQIQRQQRQDTCVKSDPEFEIRLHHVENSQFKQPSAIVEFLIFD